MNGVKTNIVLAVTICLLGLALAASPSTVLANSKYSHDNWTDEITELTNFIVDNECTGETILCEGIIRGSNQRVADRSGGSHCVYHCHLNVLGTGSYGNEYQVNVDFKHHINTGSSGLPYETTIIEKANLISHGKATNMQFFIRSHITINANGETTVSLSDAWVNCQGN